MKVTLFPTDDRPPLELIDPKSVTVTADQVLIETQDGGLFADAIRDIAEITMDLTREHSHG